MFPSVDLLPGMILSNEPGFYKEGEYGIRIENILIVQEESKKLLNFENMVNNSGETMIAMRDSKVLMATTGMAKVFR